MAEYKYLHSNFWNPLLNWSVLFIIIHVNNPLKEIIETWRDEVLLLVQVPNPGLGTLLNYDGNPVWIFPSNLLALRSPLLKGVFFLHKQNKIKQKSQVSNQAGGEIVSNLFPFVDSFSKIFLSYFQQSWVIFHNSKMITLPLREI